MKLLIVDDDFKCGALLAELLRMEDAQAATGKIAEFAIRTNLEEALAVLPECQAVISDGNFFQHPRSRFIFELWPSLFAACVKQGAKFILYSGDLNCLDRAERLGISAFLKPTLIEKLYAALVEQEPGARSQDSEESPAPEPLPHAMGER
jgi:hypothetical protein